MEGVMSQEERVLSDEDQAKVDAYLERGYNSTQRKPFRGIKLLVILYAIVILLSVFSIGLSRYFIGV
jgi:hypothetical protein